MRTIAPRTGAPEQTIAEDQEEYMPVTVCLYQTEGKAVLLMRWTFTDEERNQICDGEDLYLAVLTQGQLLQPVAMQVGSEGWIVEEAT